MTPRPGEPKLSVHRRCSKLPPAGPGGRLVQEGFWQGLTIRDCFGRVDKVVSVSVSGRARKSVKHIYVDQLVLPGFKVLGEG